MVRDDVTYLDPVFTIVIAERLLAQNCIRTSIQTKYFKKGKYANHFLWCRCQEVVLSIFRDFIDLLSM